MTADALDKFTMHAKNAGLVVLYVPPHVGKITTPGTFQMVVDPAPKKRKV